MEILELLFAFFERPLAIGALIIVVVIGVVLIERCESEPPPPPLPKCQEYTPKVNVKFWKVEVPVQVGTRCK